MVWLLFAMSERDDYPVDVRVRWTGVDTARYIVTCADTVLPLVVSSNCFRAIDRHFAARRTHYEIRVAGDTVVKVGRLLLDDVGRRLEFSGTHGVSSSVEALRFSVAERCSRAYLPRLRDVDFVFADQVGLSGQPTLSPDTVWLYGDTASLRQIDAVYTAPAAVANILDSGTFALALEPVWKRFRDVRSSADSVLISIPADKYVETTVSVPVAFRGSVGGRQVRLYPDHVDVTLWVRTKDYGQFSETQVEAAVRCNPATDTADLPVFVTRFPERARVKSVVPPAIKYVIIQ